LSVKKHLASGVAVGRPALTVGFAAFLAAMVLACSGGATPSPVTSALLPSSTPTPTLVSSPAPTPTPTPTPTATATPSGSAGAGLADIAFGYLTDLVEELGPRESATGQERAAAEYLEDLLESLGYAVKLQPFDVERFSTEDSGVVLDGPAPEPVDAIPLGMSGTGEVSGVLVPVGLALDGDIQEGGLVGKIALAERGLITFEEKSHRAAEAGAIAVVIYNNQPGNFQGVLASPGAVPVLSISRGDGRRLEELISAGGVELSVSVKLEKLSSQNVIAEKQGSGDGVVILGAHYDTVPNISSANDNASGTAVLLAIAGELSGQSFPFTLRFIAFGSEELGLLGSRHYVDSLSDEQRRRVKAMLNFDALGNGNTAGVLGNDELTRLAERLGTALGIDLEISAGLQGGGSDHMSFAGVGIPVIMFFAGDFSRIHTPRDTVSFVAPHLLGDSTGVALALLESPEFQAILN
jgi:Iap family predicted aminopeptidase